MLYTCPFWWIYAYHMDMKPATASTNHHHSVFKITPNTGAPISILNMQKQGHIYQLQWYFISWKTVIQAQPLHQTSLYRCRHLYMLNYVQTYPGTFTIRTRSSVKVYLLNISILLTCNVSFSFPYFMATFIPRKIHMSNTDISYMKLEGFDDIKLFY